MSHNIKCNNLAIIMIFLISSAFGQQYYSFGEKTLKYANNQWHEVYRGTDYKVVDSLISIRFKNGIDTVQIHNFMLQYSLQLIKKSAHNFYTFNIENSINVIELMLLIEQNDTIVDIAEHYCYAIFLDTETNNNNINYCDDPFIPDDNGYSIQWHLDMVQADCAWTIETGGNDIIVAIIDTGVDSNHEDLGFGVDNYQNLIQGYNFHNSNTNTNDIHGHGTKVTGIIGAKTNNNIGISGIAGGWHNQGVSIMPLKVDENLASTNEIIDAIYYAKINGANIINMSFGIPYNFQLDLEIEDAYNNGILIVAAAGQSISGNPVTFPANHPNVIAVAATDINDYLATGSHNDETEPNPPEIEISAPGRVIYTSAINNSYQNIHTTTTSMASPLVAGIAALLWSYEPCLTNIEIRQILRETAEQVGGYDYNWNTNYPGHSLELGYGRVNAYEALLYVDVYLEHSISSNTLWDTDKVIRRNLTIETGATLTISSQVKFGPRGKIIVKQGAKLVLDGAVLTSSLDCYDYDYLWQGIEVWGTTSASQFTAGAQGRVELKNGAIIENAVDGIRNWNPDDWNARGGIIICEDAVFRNNRRAVEFMQYHNILNGTEYDNLSAFYNTQFIVDDDYFGTSQFNAHVSLWDVKGVKFYGCTFEDNISMKPFSENYHLGIHSIDAGYTVTGSCDIMPGAGQDCPVQYYHPCEFVQLNYGIKATGSSTSNTINVYRNQFEDNIIGIFNSALNNSWLNRNSFQFGNGYAQGAAFNYGMYSLNSTGYRIEENELTSSTNSPYLTAAIIIESSGEANNMVYKNTVNNMNHRGFVAKNQNRSPWSETIGLQFQCNVNNNHPQSCIDFHVFHIGSGTQGIRGYQGVFKQYGAGNVFSTTTNSVGHFNNLSSSVKYIHSGGATQPTNYYGLTLYSSSANTCPSNFQTYPTGGETMSSSQYLQWENEYELAENNYTTILYTYNQLLDDGNTTAMLEEIQNAWSQDAWDLRNKLMAVSPYLSSEALLEAASTGILPHAMLLEVCLANPEASFGDKVLNYLATEIPDPMPQYMLDIIRNNWINESPRTSLELALASFSAQMAFLSNQILTALIIDTVSQDVAIEQWLLKRGNIDDYYYLVDISIAKDNYGSGENYLNTIPSIFELNQEQQIYFEDYYTYFSFRNSIHNDNRSIAQLTPSETELLKQISDSSQNVKVAEMCNNILCFFYNICEPVDYSLSTLPAQKSYGFSENGNSKAQNRLHVYPNPASTYATFSWMLPDSELQSIIRISSVSGNVITQYTITTNKGQWLWDTRNLYSGIYVYELINNNLILETGKINIIQ